jgi:hypothetical protein
MRAQPHERECKVKTHFDIPCNQDRPHVREPFLISSKSQECGGLMLLVSIPLDSFDLRGSL